MKINLRKVHLFSFNQILHLWPSFGEYRLVAVSIVNNVTAVYCTQIRCIETTSNAKQCSTADTWSYSISVLKCRLNGS